MDLDPRGEIGGVLVAFRLRGDDDDLGHALGVQLAGDLGGREAALRRLAPGHGDRVVEQQLVGHRRLGRDRGADRQRAGMVVGAVAQVDEDVALVGEGRGPDPG